MRDLWFLESLRDLGNMVLQNPGQEVYDSIMNSGSKFSGWVARPWKYYPGRSGSVKVDLIKETCITRSMFLEGWPDTANMVMEGLGQETVDLI